MFLDPQIISFTIAAALVTISPGPDTFLVISNTAQKDLRSGLSTIAGTLTGGCFHAALFGLGFAQIFVYSPLIFNIVKIIGAGYLLYLGTSALWSAFQSRDHSIRNQSTKDQFIKDQSIENQLIKSQLIEPDPLLQSQSSTRWHIAYRQGLITNAFNPKVILFYLAFLPQFISPDDQIAVKSVLLISIHYLLSFIWLTLIALSVNRLSLWLQNSIVQRWLDGIIGTMMIVFGVKLALANR